MTIQMGSTELGERLAQLLPQLNNSDKENI